MRLTFLSLLFLGLLGQCASAMRIETGGELLKMSSVSQISDENRHQLIAELSDRKGSTFSFPVWTIPTMVNSPGQFGAYFKTKIAVMNPTPRDFTIAVSLFNANGPVDVRQFLLKSNTAVYWDDFLGTALHYSGAGAVEFDSWFIPPGGTQDNDFTVTAEVYTESASGRYKTMVINGMRPDSLTGLRRATSIGVTVSGTERTNIGVFNDSSFSTANVTAEVHDFSGTLVETIHFSVPGHGWAQKPVNAQIDHGSIEWKTDTLVYAWTVGVDNKSNDGSLIYPTYYLP